MLRLGAQRQHGGTPSAIVDSMALYRFANSTRMRMGRGAALPRMPSGSAAALEAGRSATSAECRKTCVGRVQPVRGSESRKGPPRNFVQSNDR